MLTGLRRGRAYGRHDENLWASHQAQFDVRRERRGCSVGIEVHDWRKILGITSRAAITTYRCLQNPKYPQHKVLPEIENHQIWGHRGRFVYFAWMVEECAVYTKPRT